ncbi:hypothetical protein QEG98_08985 [Myxococcus sp. MxC21-1]|uniref:hypothetical protein n=1 Tax=Myxococcus sp. MxC21-1 TaxID=3041439 RepID=UPI002931324F|nr:hypothetical protein [Myxococcus sp. MxC21-1]WNZ63809.1 hypothetical protein QEG98_08985 [Myxococcus sp. MxC21-1]
MDEAQRDQRLDDGARPSPVPPTRFASTSKDTGSPEPVSGRWPKRPSAKAAWSAAASLLASRAWKLSC